MVGKNIAKSKEDFLFHLVGYYMSADMLEALGVKKITSTVEIEELLKKVTDILWVDQDFMSQVEFLWAAWSDTDSATKTNIAEKLNSAIKKASEGRKL